MKVEVDKIILPNWIDADDGVIYVVLRAVGKLSPGDRVRMTSVSQHGLASYFLIRVTDFTAHPSYDSKHGVQILLCREEDAPEELGGGISAVSAV